MHTELYSASSSLFVGLFIFVTLIFTTIFPCILQNIIPNSANACNFSSSKISLFIELDSVSSSLIVGLFTLATFTFS